PTAAHSDPRRRAPRAWQLSEHRRVRRTHVRHDGSRARDLLRIPREWLLARTRSLARTPDAAGLGAPRSLWVVRKQMLAAGQERAPIRVSASDAPPRLVVVRAGIPAAHCNSLDAALEVVEELVPLVLALSGLAAGDSVHPIVGNRLERVHGRS